MTNTAQHTPIRVIFDGATEITRTSNYSHGCEPIIVDHGVYPSLVSAMQKFKVSIDDLETNGKDSGWLQYQGGQNALLFIPANHQCLISHRPYADAIAKVEGM